MEVDDDCDQPIMMSSSRTTGDSSGLNFASSVPKESFFQRPAPQQNSNVRANPHFQIPTSKYLFNQRRSSSGIFITSMFGSRFRHLQKLHSDAFLGLNSICFPGLPVGAVFRSSLPATPVATPIHSNFQQFTEQAIRDRLCRTPSPRKNRVFTPLGLQPYDGDTNRNRTYGGQSHYYGRYRHDPESSDVVQPMDITSPTSPMPEPVPEGEESQNGAGHGLNNLSQSRNPFDRSNANYSLRNNFNF